VRRGSTSTSAAPAWQVFARLAGIVRVLTSSSPLLYDARCLHMRCANEALPVAHGVAFAVSVVDRLTSLGR